jgi:hypothetical protein
MFNKKKKRSKKRKMTTTTTDISIEFNTLTFLLSYNTANLFVEAGRSDVPESLARLLAKFKIY